MTPATGVPVRARLVVVAPGLGRTCAQWEPLISRLKREPGYLDNQADWLLFDHSLNALSFGHLDDVALDLRARIDEKWIASGGYNEIVLAGHSIGGLMVRQAYLSEVLRLSGILKRGTLAEE